MPAAGAVQLGWAAHRGGLPTVPRCAAWGSWVNAEHAWARAQSWGRPWAGMSLLLTTRAASGGRKGTWRPRKHSALSPAPCISCWLLWVGMGALLAAPAWAVGLAALTLCNAGDPSAVCFAVNSSFPCRHLSPRESLPCPGAFSKLSVPGKISLSGPSRQWMLSGEDECWTVAAFSVAWSDTGEQHETGLLVTLGHWGRWWFL